jgi:hypothetical protein
LERVGDVVLFLECVGVLEFDGFELGIGWNKLEFDVFEFEIHGGPKSRAESKAKFQLTRLARRELT